MGAAHRSVTPWVAAWRRMVEAGVDDLVTHTWDGAFAKIQRAQKHLHELGEAVSDYSHSDPAEVASEFDPDRNEWVVRLKVHEAPPPEIPLIVGDVVHNLRSALDYLAWELVWANGRIPADNVQFPLFKKEPVHFAGIREPGDAEPAALALIESVQPYHRRDHPLGVLRDLSNADKHRSLRAVLWYVKGLKLTMEGHEGGFVPGARIIRGPFTDGAELASYPAEHHPNVYVDLHDAVSIKLEDGGGPPQVRGTDEVEEPPMVVSQLVDIAAFVVGDVFAPLRPFLS